MFLSFTGYEAFRLYLLTAIHSEVLLCIIAFGVLLRIDTAVLLRSETLTLPSTETMNSLNSLPECFALALGSAMRDLSK